MKKFSQTKFKKALLSQRSIENDLSPKEVVDQLNTIDPDLKLTDNSYRALEAGKRPPTIGEYGACVEWLNVNHDHFFEAAPPVEAKKD